MSGKFEHFIPENCALPNATMIGIYDADNIKQGSIKIPSHMLYPTETKLYSFCALADTHLTYSTANEDFQRALTYAENNCDFTCIAGDLTSGGTESEMELHKSIVDTYSPTKPVYAIAGNHETYDTVSKDYLQNYTGQPLYYSFTKGDDVYIMLGHYSGGGSWAKFVSQDEIQWLYETLEENRNKRCFVFIHALPHEHEVGNPCNSYQRALVWYVNDNGIGTCVINLLKHYKNTILFHGHSHTRFWLQQFDKKANYSDSYGYRSVHIPSLSAPRNINEDTGLVAEVYAESEGYVVDVFENCIVLKGRDFIDNEKNGVWLPIGTYKIDTTLVEIEANTFTDSTGTITT